MTGVQTCALPICSCCGNFVFAYPQTGGNPGGYGVIENQGPLDYYGIWVFGDTTPLPLGSLGLIAGNTYTFVADMKIVSGDTIGGLKVDFFPNSVTPNSTGDMRPPSGTTSWATYSYSVTIPQGTTGIKVVTVPDLRWKRRDIKTVMLLAPSLGKQEAYERGAQEAWMVEDGFVTEGTSSNAYIVKDGKVITRGLSNSILAGCTRHSLFRLARERGIVIEERAFTPDEAYGADEAFLTSASQFVMPIAEIDGRRIGGGQPGPVVRRLRELILAAAQGQ